MSGILELIKSRKTITNGEFANRISNSYLEKNSAKNSSHWNHKPFACDFEIKK